MLDELADVFGNALGWDAEQRQAEVARTLSILADRHGVILPNEHRDNVGEVGWRRRMMRVVE
jgi:glycerol-3-phosphate dehydrogenase